MSPNIPIVLSTAGLLERSNPAAKTWHVSKQTPILSDSLTPSSISLSSSNLDPTLCFCPAIVSTRSTVLPGLASSASLHAPMTFLTPSIVPFPMCDPMCATR